MLKKHSNIGSNLDWEIVTSRYLEEFRKLLPDRE